MSAKWINSFPGETYERRRRAYAVWLYDQPKQLDGCNLVIPELEWPMYPVAHLQPGQYFVVPTGDARSLKTIAWRQRAPGRNYAVKQLDDKRCACLRLA